MSDDDRFWLCNPCDHEATESGSYCPVHSISFDKDAPCPEAARRLAEAWDGGVRYAWGDPTPKDIASLSCRADLDQNPYRRVGEARS